MKIPKNLLILHEHAIAGDQRARMLRNTMLEIVAGIKVSDLDAELQNTQDTPSPLPDNAFRDALTDVMGRDGMRNDTTCDLVTGLLTLQRSCGLMQRFVNIDSDATPDDIINAIRYMVQLSVNLTDTVSRLAAIVITSESFVPEPETNTLESGQ